MPPTPQTIEELAESILVEMGITPEYDDDIIFKENVKTTASRITDWLKALCEPSPIFVKDNIVSLLKLDDVIRVRNQLRTEILTKAGVQE